MRPDTPSPATVIDRRRIEVLQRQLKRRAGGLDLTIDLRFLDAWRDPAGEQPASWNAAWLFVKYRQLVTQHHSDEQGLLAHIASGAQAHDHARAQLALARRQGQSSLRLTQQQQVQSHGGVSHAQHESHAREVLITLKSGGAANKLSYSSHTWSDWQHALLDKVTVPRAAGAARSLPDDRMGVFLYRATPGSGACAMKGIRLRWLNDEPSPIQVWVHALEMIYIPEGAFELGDPGDPAREGTPTNAFHRSTPSRRGSWIYSIQSEKKIKVVQPTSTDPGLTWNSESYGSWGDIPRAFPKGHRAFYCMRTQLTQGQFADFMNSLSGSAKTAHFPYGGQGDYRYTVFKTDSGQRYATRPARACNWVSWGDFIAYAWWAGLRPLTELEWEKAARGQAAAVDNEYVWGTTKLVRTNVILGDEAGASIATGNCHIDSATNPLEGGDGGYGPVCDDGFLIDGGVPGASSYGVDGEPAPQDPREASGASYYRVMGMSGNLWDYVISAGAEQGRRFTGVNGNGVLTDTGEPDWGDQQPPPWPGIDGLGSGFRGGSWYTASNRAQLADRTSACGLPGYVFRSHDTGIRAGRTAPGQAKAAKKKRKK